MALGCFKHRHNVYFLFPLLINQIENVNLYKIFQGFFFFQLITVTFFVKIMSKIQKNSNSSSSSSAFTSTLKTYSSLQFAEKISPNNSCAVSKALKDTVFQNKNLKFKIQDLKKQIQRLKSQLDEAQRKTICKMCEKKNTKKNNISIETTGQTLSFLKQPQFIPNGNNIKNSLTLNKNKKIMDNFVFKQRYSSSCDSNNNEYPIFKQYQNDSKKENIYSILQKQLQLLNKQISYESQHKNKNVLNDQNQTKSNKNQLKHIQNEQEKTTQHSQIHNICRSIEKQLIQKFQLQLPRKLHQIIQQKMQQSPSQGLLSSQLLKSNHMLSSVSSNNSSAASTLSSNNNNNSNPKPNLKRCSNILIGRDQNINSLNSSISNQKKKVQIVQQSVKDQHNLSYLNYQDCQQDIQGQNLNVKMKKTKKEYIIDEDCNQKSQKNSSQLTIMLNGSVIDICEDKNTMEDKQGRNRLVLTDKNPLKKSIEPSHQNKVKRRVKKQVSLKIQTQSSKILSFNNENSSKENNQISIQKCQKRYSQQSKSMINHLSVKSSTKSKKQSKFCHQTNKSIHKRNSLQSQKTTSQCHGRNHNKQSCICRSDMSSEIGLSGDQNRSMTGLKNFQHEMLRSGLANFISVQNESYKTLCFSKGFVNKYSDTSDRINQNENGQNVFISSKKQIQSLSSSSMSLDEVILEEDLFRA